MQALPEKKFKIKPNFFYRLLLSIVAIIVIIIIVTFFATNYYLGILENKVVESQQKTLNLITRNLINSTVWLSLDNTIQSIISSNSFKRMDASHDPVRDFPHGHPMLGIQEYNYLSKDILHSVYFINIKQGIVITDKGTEKTDSFFKIHFPDLPEYRILNTYFQRYPKPAKFYLNINDIYPEYVYPNFFTYSDTSENMIMINYSERFYYTFLNQNKPSLNSDLFIIRTDGIVLAHSNRNKIYTSITSPQILDQIKACKPFYTDYFGDERLIVSSVGVKGQDYYVATIPYKDIYDQPIAIRNMLIIIGVSIIALSVVVAFVLRKIHNKPINKLFAFFGPLTGKKNGSIDDLTFLENNIENLLEDRKKLDIALPRITDQHLVKLLKEDFDFKEDNMGGIFRQEGMYLPDNQFVAAVVELFFTNEFIERHNREEQVRLIKETYHSLINTYATAPHTHTVQVKKNTLCLVFTIKDQTMLKEVLNNLKGLDGKNDLARGISVLCGIGKAHQGILGLKQSFKEASSALLSLSLSGPKRVAFYTTNHANDIKYQYDTEDENRLTNLILSGHRDEALGFLNTIITRNQKKRLSVSEMKELYLKLYFTGRIILAKKKLSLNDGSSPENMNITEAYKEMNVIDLSQYVFNLLIKIINSSNNHKRGKLDIETVMDYIDTNLSRDYSLEMIADTFKVSTGHLSYLLKDHLGMSYQEYINDLRIKRAKKMLTGTRDTIDCISTQCGFNSRHTFIRMFKKLEGITPTQFRVL
jgi:two-component system response regulator YesN